MTEVNANENYVDFVYVKRMEDGRVFEGEDDQEISLELFYKAVYEDCEKFGPGRGRYEESMIMGVPIKTCAVNFSYENHANVYQNWLSPTVPFGLLKVYTFEALDHIRIKSITTTRVLKSFLRLKP